MGVRLYSYKRNGVTDEAFLSRRDTVLGLEDITYSDEMAMFEMDHPLIVDEPQGCNIHGYRSILRYISENIDDKDNLFWKTVFTANGEDNSTVDVAVIIKYIESSKTIPKNDKTKLLKAFKYHLDKDYIVMQG